MSQSTALIRCVKPRPPLFFVYFLRALRHLLAAMRWIVFRLRKGKATSAKHCDPLLNESSKRRKAHSKSNYFVSGFATWQRLFRFLLIVLFETRVCRPIKSTSHAVQKVQIVILFGCGLHVRRAVAKKLHVWTCFDRGFWGLASRETQFLIVCSNQNAKSWLCGKSVIFGAPAAFP